MGVASILAVGQTEEQVQKQNRCEQEFGCAYIW